MAWITGLRARGCPSSSEILRAPVVELSPFLHYERPQTGGEKAPFAPGTPQ